MQNLWPAVQKLPKRELTALVLLLIAIPVSIFLVQKNQELREKASPLTQVTQGLKVWLLQYIPPSGIQSLYPLAQVTDPVVFTRDTLLPAMNNASRYHGYSDPSAQPALNYTLESSRTENNPPPETTTPTNSGTYDYSKLFSTYDLCNYAKANGINAVILWAAGSGSYNGGFWESAITGNKGIPTNGASLTTCPDKTIVVYGLNYERGLAEALESYGHHLETAFRHFESTGPTRYSRWSDNDSCGTDHNPPNARNEYDRSNTVDFQSDCRNWKPDGTGAKETLNCNAWGCTGEGWLKWWMQNIPGIGNTLIDADGRKIPNWWVYIGDPDRCYNNALSCSGFGVSPSPPPTSSPTPTPKPTPLGGDIDKDGDVDIFDYNILVTNFGKRTPQNLGGADLDNDGDVDIFDYNLVVTNFGRSL